MKTTPLDQRVRAAQITALNPEQPKGMRWEWVGVGLFVVGFWVGLFLLVASLTGCAQAEPTRWKPCGMHADRPLHERLITWGEVAADGLYCECWRLGTEQGFSDEYSPTPGRMVWTLKAWSERCEEVDR